VNDQELAARARQLAEDGVRSAEAQALARELLRQLADRLEGPKAAGWTVTYGTPAGDVYEAAPIAPSPEGAAWLVARDLPRDGIEDAPGVYTLLDVKPV
jgi:hypothetical protein